MEILVGLGSLIVGMVLAYFFGGRRVEKEQKAKQERRNKEAEEFRNEVENRIARDGDAKRKLRQDWSE